MEPDALIAMTGAGGAITVGGKLLTIRQLTVTDMGMLRAWLRDRLPRPMATFLEQLKEIQELKEIDPETYDQCRKDLLLKAHEADREQRAGGTPGYAMEVAEGEESIAYMLWLSCRKDHPDETFESLCEKLKDESLERVKQVLDRANMAWFPEKAKEDAAKKEAAKNGNSPFQNKKVPLPG